MSSDLRLYDVLRGAVVSEKANLLSSLGQIVFKVDAKATKKEIAAAVQLVMNLKVRRVTTVNMKSRRKGYKGRPGRMAVYKKAYVCLEPGQNVEGVGENYGISQG